MECDFGWLKELQRIATRYDKLARSFRTRVCLACIEHCLRADFLEQIQGSWLFRLASWQGWCFIRTNAVSWGRTSVARLL
ncbi:hypothetical protein [Billgrantia tianxiuensis]|uniref:hypothetical protein n=1 Tax=Billgrantia tianxiuensis TaxID=2497861 RepID=UPI003BEED7EE